MKRPTADVMSTFIELSDERGEAVLVDRTEIALVRDCGDTAYARSVIVLKCGESVALQTKFADVSGRIAEAQSTSAINERK